METHETHETHETGERLDELQATLDRLREYL